MPRAFKAFATGAALSNVFQLTIPVNTSATDPYKIAQMTSVARIPIGMSLFGRRHSSAAQETESNPMEVKKMISAPVRKPDDPLGIKGGQFAGFTALAA